MSHELRTPLNAILGFAQILQRDKKSPLTERQQERLAHVTRGGEHLLKLIDDVLDLARIEAGRITITPETVDVDETLADVRSSLEPFAGRASMRLNVTHMVSGQHVRADRTRLTQILMNFGSNAVKYGREGGHVTFIVERRGPRLRMAVRDDGIGIPEAQHARIFEPFHRAGQETGPIEGTGIGLAISKRLAELMDGAVGFTSTVGVGSEFWVEVPLDVDAMAAPEVEPPRTDGADVAQRTVLYVEDNPSNVAFMRAVFDDLTGLELVVAPTAEEGLALVRARRPAIIIMDLNLPGMSGLEAMRMLAADELTHTIPVIALTAAAMPHDAALAAGAGFCRYLTKPVRVDVLCELLDDLS